MAHGYPLHTLNSIERLWIPLPSKIIHAEKEIPALPTDVSRLFTTGFSPSACN